MIAEAQRGTRERDKTRERRKGKNSGQTENPGPSAPPEEGAQGAGGKGIVLDVQFHYHRRNKPSGKQRSQWIDSINWFIKGTNDNCNLVKITGLTDHGDETNILPKKTVFASDLGAPYLGAVDRLNALIGNARLVGLVGNPANTRWFHIATFKKVKVKPRFKNGKRDPNSTGSVPGKFLHPNVMAADTKSGLVDKRHEVGHLFGLVHEDPGLMRKVYPKRGKGYYLDKDEFKPAWCSKIQQHLNL